MLPTNGRTATAVEISRGKSIQKQSDMRVRNIYHRLRD